MRTISSLTFCLFALFTLSTHASASKTNLNGTWVGQYQCAGRAVDLTLVVEGDRGQVRFAYPGKGVGEHSVVVRYDASKKLFSARPLKWIERPPGLQALSISGEPSPDLSRIAGRVASCGSFDIHRTDDALAVSAQAPNSRQGGTPENSNRSFGAPITVASPSSTQSSQAARPTNSRPSDLSGTWKGEYTCQRATVALTLEVDGDSGRFIYTFPGSKTGEFLFTVIGYKQASGHFQTRAREWVRRVENHVTQDIGGRVSPDGNRLSGRVPSCGEFHVSRMGLLPPPSLAAGMDLSSLVGSWDGAVFTQRSYGQEYTPVPLAMVVRPNSEGLAHRPFTVELQSGDRRVDSWLEVQDRTPGRLAIRTGAGPQGLNVTGGVTAQPIRAHGQDYIELTMSTGFAIGRGVLWRRPEGRRSLESVCRKEVEAWLMSRSRARNIARELKVSFFPALASYDTERASLAHAAGTLQQLASIAGDRDIADLLMQCATTTPFAKGPEGEGLVDGFLEWKTVVAYRRSLASHAKPGEIAPPPKASFQIDPSATNSKWESAERALPDLLLRAERARTLKALLDTLEASVKDFQPARPEVVQRTLAPLEARIDAFEREISQRRLAEVQLAASKRMAGVKKPAAGTIPTGRERILEAIAEGNTAPLSGSDLGFLGGMLSRSIETCGQPAASVRMTLNRILEQSILRSHGTDFKGDLNAALASMATNSAHFAQGAKFVEELGCAHPYPSAIYDALAVAEPLRAAGGEGRPSLFVRSCALDNSIKQCGCLQTHFEITDAQVSSRRYSPDMVNRLMSRSPLGAAKLGLTCGVNR
jgi:hypothetical protein